MKSRRIAGAKSIKKLASIQGRYFGLTAAIIVLNLSLLAAPTAHATSAYDNTLVLTSDLKYNDENEGVYSIANTWRTHLAAACGSTIYNDLLEALDGGAWAISQDGTNDDYGVTVVWSKSDNIIPESSFYSEYMFNPPLKYLATNSGWQGKARFHFNSASDTEVCDYSTVAINNSYGNTLSMEAWTAPLGLYASTYDINYPFGYAGVIFDGSIDQDGDDLSMARERTQGTSDSNPDSDGDGLSDNIESQWYPSRDAIFCKTSVTPHVCSYPHPTVKDVYIEIDWMHDGTNSFKPSDTQVGLVSDAFATKGIYFHADTGQYGGGNQVVTYTASLDIPKGSGADYFDYKDGNFSSGRQGIWRYMLSGNNYSADTSSSGVTYTGSDNIFVSYGLVKGSQTAFGYTDQDTALAGTMLHEIGHSLCMSGTKKYSYQSAACIYDGVDSGNAYPDYISSLNYTRQMGMVDYSTGTNGSSNDHNDWSAVAGHMGDFTQWDYDTQHDYSPGVSAKPQMAKGITIGIAQKLKAKGLLRPGKTTWRHLKVDPKGAPTFYKGIAAGLGAKYLRSLVNR